MKKYLILTALTTLIFTGCSAPRNSLSIQKQAKSSYVKPSAAKSAAFQKTMMEVALSTKKDPKYQKLELDSPAKKAWFKNLMYQLWDRQITKKAFIAKGLSLYPNHMYELNFISNGFQNKS